MASAGRTMAADPGWSCAAGRGVRRPPGPRPRRRLVWRGAAPLVFLLAGALFVTSWSSAGGTDLRGGRYDDLPGLAEAETRQLEQLRAEQEDLAAEVDQLTEDARRPRSGPARAAERPARPRVRPAAARCSGPG